MNDELLKVDSILKSATGRAKSLAASRCPAGKSEIVAVMGLNGMGEDDAHEGALIGVLATP